MTVFLDRDGVINRKLPEDHYVRSWSEFEFLPGTLEALKILAGVFARIVVITNQRGIARGLMTMADLEAIHVRMLDDIAAAGGRIDSIYVCPHDREECDCRKPLPGLFLQARREHPEIRFTESVMVGDSISDLLPAFGLGIRAELVATGSRRAEILAKCPVRQVLAVETLLEFARLS
jgi:D-glycero-D-manno-heptose 1,7-bisphosphate phosphatase